MNPTQVAINNLAHWVDQFKRENVGKATPPVVVAAEYLLDSIKEEQ